MSEAVLFKIAVWAFGIFGVLFALFMPALIFGMGFGAIGADIQRELWKQGQSGDRPKAEER